MTENQHFLTLRFDNRQPRGSSSAKNAAPVQNTAPSAVPVPSTALVESLAPVQSVAGGPIELPVEDAIEDLPELPKDLRIGLAHKAWNDANGQLSIKKAAHIF